MKSKPIENRGLGCPNAVGYPGTKGPQGFPGIWYRIDPEQYSPDKGDKCFLDITGQLATKERVYFRQEPTHNSGSVSCETKAFYGITSNEKRFLQGCYSDSSNEGMFSQHFKNIDVAACEQSLIQKGLLTNHID